jgi:hypothetical protein
MVQDITDIDDTPGEKRALSGMSGHCDTKEMASLYSEAGWLASKHGQLPQVMFVLRSQQVAGVEEHLLVDRKAAHGSASESSNGERSGRISEVRSVGIALYPKTLLVESDGVDVDPALTACGDLNPQWEPVRLNGVAEASESSHACAVVAGVQGQVQVAVRSCLDPD